MIKLFAMVKGGYALVDEECSSILNTLGIKGKIKEMSGG